MWLIAPVTLTVALGPAPAVAAGPPLPVPALAQYVESLPTSAGPIVTAAVKPRAGTLPGAVREKVATYGGPDAETIEEIATSSVYGAPQTELTRPGRGHSESQRGTTETPQALPATFQTDGSGTSRVPILTTLMLASAVAMAFAARRLRD